MPITRFMPQNMQVAGKRNFSPQIAMSGGWRKGLGKLAARRGAYVPHETNGLTCPTEASRGIENIGEYRRLSNPKSVFAKENPDASAKANGADQLGISFETKEYRLRAERATTLCMAIADCDPRESLQIMAAALEDMSRGSPLPVLLSPMEDARWWASFAQPNELKSYAVACFEAMAPKVQVSFLAHVQRGASA